MNKRWLLAMQVLKIVFKLTFTALSVIFAIGSDSRTGRRHSPMKAELLHEEGLMSDAEYMRSLRGDK